MPVPLTKRQAEVYEYIRMCITDRRYSPTISEISKELGYKNAGGAWDLVNKIEKKGWITRMGGKGWSRYIVLGKDSW